MTTTNELHAAIYTTQKLLKQAADVIEHNANSLAEAHARNGIIEDREVQAAVESDIDLVAHLRAAALPWDQRHKKPEPTMKMLHTYGDTPQRECLCKDKCLHTGTIGQCKGLPSVLAAPVQQGWKLVPVEPTMEMIAALGFDGAVDMAIGHAAISKGIEDAYTAMLDAAPQPAQQQEPIYQIKGFDTGNAWHDASHDAYDMTLSRDRRIVYASPQPAQQQEPVAPAFDIKTSKGGRGFVEWYFSRVLKRHDFTDYIRTALAADFACALAKGLSTSPQLAQQQEPIYQCQDSTGKWTDQAKHSYDYNVKHGSATVRIVYLAPQPPVQQEPTDSMGMPISCGKPLCSPGDHHPLCKLAEKPDQLSASIAGVKEECTKNGLTPERVEFLFRTWCECRLKHPAPKNSASDANAEFFMALDAFARVVEQTAPVQEPVAAAVKDAVFDAAIELVGTLAGMKPPPIETAPPEIFKPFRDFTEKVCLIFAAPQPAQQQEPVDVAAFVEGMEVSIDVSTGDHDSGNRLFGTVTLVQENQGSKHGLILLVQDPEANFKTATPQPAQQEPVAWTWDTKSQHDGFLDAHFQFSKPESSLRIMNLRPLYAAPQPSPVQEPVAKMGMYEHKCPDVTGHRGPSFVCQKAGHGVGQNSYCNVCTCPEALNTSPQPAQQEPVAWTWDTKSQHDGFLDAHFQFSKPESSLRIMNLRPLYAAPQPSPVQEPVAKMGMYEHKCPDVTGHRGPSFVCQKAGHGVGQNSYCNVCTCPEALNTSPQPAQQEPVAWTWDTKSQHDGFLDAHFQFSKPESSLRIMNLRPLYAAPQPSPVQEPVAKMGMYEHKCPDVTGHRGPSFVCQKAGHGVGQNSYCNVCTCPEALNTSPQPAQQEPVAWTWDTKSQHDGFLDAHFQFSKPESSLRIMNLRPLYAAPQPSPVQEPVAKMGMYEHKCPDVTGHRGPSFVCQKAGHGVGQNSYCNVCTCPEALNTSPQPAQQEPVAWTWELQDNGSKYFGESWDKAEQPAQQQEPTKAMIDATERIDWSDSDVRGNIVNMWQAMCAAAPQPAQPLTDDEIQECWYKTQGDAELFARAVEAAHGITKGNT